jgi:hypothetical protein
MTTSLYALLKKGPVVVHFIKEDGSERVMRATTNENMITYLRKTDEAKAPPRNLMRVWDLDIKEWRSIRKDRVIGWTESK